MEVSFIAQNPKSSRAKTLATLAVVVLGTLAVSYLVFSNMPGETEFIFKAPNNQTLQDLYAGWKKQFNVTYGGPEDSTRFKIFTNTYMMIAQINYRNLSYTLGLNEFSTMTNEEFSATKLGYNAISSRFMGASRNFTKLPIANLRETVDWTTKGAVTPIKNQGRCGSCWAFSAIGALEGLSAIKGKLQDFSEQELVDCSRNYGNNGCNGGLMDHAFKYARDKGVSLQAAYPYKGVDSTCKVTTGDKFKIRGYTDVPSNSASQLKAAIAKQPVSVAVQADSTIFRNYKSGVVTGTSCGTSLNHGVLAVGYETTGTPFFKVKNSWGTAWGDKGYIRIGITDGAGVCGIQKSASYPTA